MMVHFQLRTFLRNAHSSAVYLLLISCMLSGCTSQTSVQGPLPTSPDNTTVVQETNCAPDSDPSLCHPTCDPQSITPCEKGEANSEPYADSLGVAPIQRPENLTDQEIQQIIADFQSGKNVLSDYERELILNALMRSRIALTSRKDQVAVAREILSFREARSDGYALRGTYAAAFTLIMGGAASIPNFTYTQTLGRRAHDYIKTAMIKRNAALIAKEFGLERAESIKQALAFYEAKSAVVLEEGVPAWKTSLKVQMQALEEGTLKKLSSTAKGAVKWGRGILLAGATVGIVYASYEFIEVFFSQEGITNAELALLAADSELTRQEDAIKRLQKLFSGVTTIPTDKTTTTGYIKKQKGLK